MPALSAEKLVYPDGRLQEAGGVIFSDGSGLNFGKNEDADDPVYNFVREVDYCSGALLATRRTLFLELGGFDLRFEPAYYEDTDYCFTCAGRVTVFTISRKVRSSTSKAPHQAQICSRA